MLYTVRLGDWPCCKCSGVKLCAGWPRQVTVAASTEGASGCLITGSALSGVFCNVPFQLSLTVTDCFANSRCFQQN